MSYLNQEKFEEKPKGLVFNAGKTGIVKECKVTVVKKTSSDAEKSPDYKIIVFDKSQQENKDTTIQNYPVNKGYYYNNKFKSEKQEKFAVNELKHLLKIFGHSLNLEKEIITTTPVNSYNEFLDYTMNFIRTSVPKLFDVVVDYGTSAYPKQFLQLNGYPWWIGECNSKLSNASNVLLERPKPDEQSNGTQESTTPWDNLQQKPMDELPW